MSNAPGAILATLLIASVATAAERTMVHEAVVEAPIADVWAAFTTKQGVESWMVPLAEVDLRVGGTLRTSYNPDGRIGDETTIVHRILSYEPQRMLSMKVEQSPSGFAHDVVESTWGVIQLEPLAPDRTRVRVAGMGWQEGEQWDEAWAFFEAGNAYTLRALQERFAADADQGEADDDEVWRIVSGMVGGAWEHEAPTDGGDLFRSRNVIEYGPARRSLVGQGWLGNRSGMFEHGRTMVWREPAAADGSGGGGVRFINLNERGDVARGAIRLEADDTVAWDWASTSPGGVTQRFDIAMRFEGADRYRMIMRRAVDGELVELMNIAFDRVATDAPGADGH